MSERALSRFTVKLPSNKLKRCKLLNILHLPILMWIETPNLQFLVK